MSLLMARDTLVPQSDKELTLWNMCLKRSNLGVMKSLNWLLLQNHSLIPHIVPTSMACQIGGPFLLELFLIFQSYYNFWKTLSKINWSLKFTGLPPCSQVERDLLALQVRLGGLGITNPETSAPLDNPWHSYFICFFFFCCVLHLLTCVSYMFDFFSSSWWLSCCVTVTTFLPYPNLNTLYCLHVMLPFVCLPYMESLSISIVAIVIS